MARKVKNLSTRENFIILTNGKETEKNYFELIKSQKSIYNVSVVFQNEDPLSLVECAIRNYSKESRVWCVFDVDLYHEQRKIEPAIKKAKENNVQIALSNISFEVWLLSHFQKTNIQKTEKELEKEISQFLIKASKKQIQYLKADKDLLKKYFIPNTSKAITNAQIVHETNIKEYREKHGTTHVYPIWNWNPCTTVYLLIKALKLQNC